MPVIEIRVGDWFSLCSGYWLPALAHHPTALFVVDQIKMFQSDGHVS